MGLTNILKLAGSSADKFHSPLKAYLNAKHLPYEPPVRFGVTMIPCVVIALKISLLLAGVVGLMGMGLTNASAAKGATLAGAVLIGGAFGGTMVGISSGIWVRTIPIKKALFPLTAIGLLAFSSILGVLSLNTDQYKMLGAATIGVIGSFAKCYEAAESGKINLEHSILDEKISPSEEAFFTAILNNHFSSIQNSREVKKKFSYLDPDQLVQFPSILIKQLIRCSEKPSLDNTPTFIHQQLNEIEKLRAEYFKAMDQKKFLSSREVLALTGKFFENKRMKYMSELIAYVSEKQAPFFTWEYIKKIV